MRLKALRATYRQCRSDGKCASLCATCGRISGRSAPATGRPLVTAVDTGVLLIRLVVGATLLMHAWNHWFGGGKIAGTAGWFESLGLRPGWVHARASVVTEVAAGLGLILGLLTPFAAAAAIGPMVVA